jgi:hypothetical protein
MNRTLLLALALAAASLTRATPALAGSSCGGGHSSGGGGHSSSGGGSSGGGSSGGGSYDFSSSDSTPAAPACTDETDIVGYRHCTKFGAWASSGSHARLLILDLGVSVRTFESPLSSSTGTVTHADESFTYRVAGGAPSPSSPAQPPSETAVVSTLRVGSATPRGFYLLAEGELGGLVRNASQVEMTSTGLHGAPSIKPDASLVTGVLGVAGVHGVVGDTTLGVEVAGGVRSITYQYESRYLSCQTSSSQTVSSPVLEVRARASRWISPFVNVGASAGASVIDRGAWVAGVHLGFATQAYGNLRD